MIAPGAFSFPISHRQTYNQIGASAQTATTCQWKSDEEMDTALSVFLAGLTPTATETDQWGELAFQVAGYLTTSAPPLEYVTSVRAVVTHGENALVITSPDREHILPGGRREMGESLTETLRREALEETGWSLSSLRLLGFKQFRHLTPKPDGYAYPYPDFLQAIYAATAEAYYPEQRIMDDYELGARFLPLAEVRTLLLSPVQRMFLDAAMAVQ
jgi:8-oxo-dGTP pyrophosphatase MutT (NUDIX family)